MPSIREDGYTDDTADKKPAEQERPTRKSYDLGEPAEDVYESLTTGRQQVIEMGRHMAELTIPSVCPPDGYHTGDDLPGNNQSIGAQAVNNLASNLMFMAFPPGQPMMRLEPVEHRLQKAIDADPDLWAKTELALSRLEQTHRKRAATINLATAWVGYQKLKLVAGNALWKHVTLEAPTFFGPEHYVVSRDRGGHPLLVIHKETVRVSTLDDDLQDQIYEADPELKENTREWERECDIYSVCRLVSHESGMRGKAEWEYWQEHEGFLLDGTEITTDYDDCPMWAGWMIPVYGSNWGRSYCEEYRGDLYTLEANASAVNDGAALAAWALTFVKPGGTTSLRQVRDARNLDTLSGNAADVTVFRSDKTADLNFVVGNLERAARRIGAAFLLQSAVRREGERVTAEEVVRVAQELDRAMGGVYTETAQGDQRRMVGRFIRLHEDDNKDLPVIPEGVIEVQVVTGVDAMGRSIESQALTKVIKSSVELFGPEAVKMLNGPNLLTRLFASEGVKPDGLVKDAKTLAAEVQQAEQKAAGMALLEKGVGPIGGALTKGGMDAMMAAGPQQPPTQEGPTADG